MSVGTHPAQAKLNSVRHSAYKTREGKQHTACDDQFLTQFATESLLRILMYYLLPLLTTRYSLLSVRHLPLTTDH